MHAWITLFCLLAFACGGGSPRPATLSESAAESVHEVEAEAPVLVEVPLGLADGGWESGGESQFGDEVAEWERCQAAGEAGAPDCSIGPRILGFCDEAYVSLEVPELPSCGDDPISYEVRRTGESGALSQSPASAETVWGTIRENMSQCEAARDVRHAAVTRPVGIRGATVAVELGGELRGLFLAIQSEGSEHVVYLAKRDERGVELGRVACADECELTPSILHVTHDGSLSRLAVSWSLVSGEHCAVDRTRSAAFAIEGVLPLLR